MDNEMKCDLMLRLDVTLESMWIVRACHECKKKLRTTQGDKQMRAGAAKCATTVSGLCFDKYIDTLDQSALIHTRSSPNHVDFLK